MIKNLTPHDINIVSQDGSPVATIPYSGTVARVRQTTVPAGTIDGIPITRSEFGEVTGLPEPQAGIYYVVSLATAKAAAHRDDLLVTNQAVRDEHGNILGCQSLSRI